MPETGRDAKERKHEDVSPLKVHHPSEGERNENSTKAPGMMGFLLLGRRKTVAWDKKRAFRVQSILIIPVGISFWMDLHNFLLKSFLFSNIFIKYQTGWKLLRMPHTNTAM